MEKLERNINWERGFQINLPIKALFIVAMLTLSPLSQSKKNPFKTINDTSKEVYNTLNSWGWQIDFWWNKTPNKKYKIKIKYTDWYEIEIEEENILPETFSRMPDIFENWIDINWFETKKKFSWLF